MGGKRREVQVRLARKERSLKLELGSDDHLHELILSPVFYSLKVEVGVRDYLSRFESFS